MINVFNSLRIFLVVLAFGYMTPVYSERIPPNSVSSTASARVSYDPNTGLYTYQYSFTNSPNSLLSISNIMVPLNGSSAINIVVPKGWYGGTWTNGSVVDFAAVDIGIPPPRQAGDPEVRRLPSPYQIKQSQTLGGFSFQSVDPPEIINFYAQGFTQLPEASEESEPGQLAPSPLDPSESSKGQAKGPKYSDQLYLGNRRPAVDGFLAFRNITDRDTKPAPIQIDIEFGINGETVNQNTFRATLNSKDVTAQFKPTGPKTMRAVFQPTQLNIGGRNALLTTVQGIIPSNGRTAGDVDRVVFTAQP